jgi:hypothetical protein
MRRNCRSRSRDRTRTGLGLTIAQNLQLACEERTLFDRDATGLYVSLNDRALAHISALPGFNIAVDRATYSHIFGGNIGADPAIRANCQTVAVQLDSAFHLAINEDVLAAGELSADEYRSSKVGEILRTSHIQLPLSSGANQSKQDCKPFEVSEHDRI